MQAAQFGFQLCGGKAGYHVGVIQPNLSGNAVCIGAAVACQALVYSALLPLLAAGVLYPLNFVLHPIDSVILMTLFVAWLLSGTARLNSFDPKPASQSEPQKEPAE